MSKIYDKLKELESVREEELEDIEIVEEDTHGYLKKKSLFKTFILLTIFFAALFLGYSIAKYYTSLSKFESKKIVIVPEKTIKDSKIVTENRSEKTLSPSNRFSDKQRPYFYKGSLDFIKRLEKKYNDDPNNPVNANNLSVAYSEEGRYEEALRYAEKALLLSPNNAFYWNNLGVVLTYLNLLSDAEKCFKKALEISKEEGVFFYNMANLYERLGSSALAKENYLSYLSKSDRINPSYLEIVRNKYYKGDK